MTTREVMNAVLREKGLHMTDISRMLGWGEQSFAQKMIRDSIKMADFISLMDRLGYRVEFVDKETGEKLNVATKGYGTRVTGMSEYVKYDTEYSSALSNSFYYDGTNEYGPDGKASELYIDSEGRYFLAEYSKSDETRNRIVAVSSDVALAFIDRYGRDLHLDRKKK